MASHFPFYETDTYHVVECWMLLLLAFTSTCPFFFVMKIMFNVFCWFGSSYVPHVVAMCLCDYFFFFRTIPELLILTLRVLNTYFFKIIIIIIAVVPVVWRFLLCDTQLNRQHNTMCTKPCNDLFYYLYVHFPWQPL